MYDHENTMKSLLSFLIDAGIDVYIVSRGNEIELQNYFKKSYC